MSTDDLYIGSLPHAPGSDTSRQSARASQRTAHRDATRIFEFIRDRGLEGATQDEVTVATGIVTQTAVARLNDLRKRNWIRDSGMRRRTQRNRLATVWVPRPESDRLVELPPRRRARRACFYRLTLTHGGVIPDGPFDSATERDAATRNTTQESFTIDLDIDQEGILTTRCQHGQP